MGQYGSYQNDTAADTSPYPSAALWKKLDALSERKGRTYGLWDDFAGGNDEDLTVGAIARWEPHYWIFGSSGSAVAQETDEVGGVYTFTEATDDEAISVKQGTNPFRLSSSFGLIAFEARVKLSSIANDASNLFVGLCEDVTQTATVPLTAAGALSDNNMIGFHHKEADGDKWDFSYKANTVTAVDLVADAATLVADTYMKLGFIYDPDIDTSVRCYVDGQKIAHTATTPTVGTGGTDMPNDVNLGVMLAHVADDGTPGTISIDWWKCFQARVT